MSRTRQAFGLSSLRPSDCCVPPESGTVWQARHGRRDAPSSPLLPTLLRLCPLLLLVLPHARGWP